VKNAAINNMDNGIPATRAGMNLGIGVWLIEKKHKPETPTQIALPIKETILRGIPQWALNRAFAMKPPKKNTEFSITNLMSHWKYIGDSVPDCQEKTGQSRANRPAE